MTVGVQIADGTATALLQALRALIDSGDGPGRLLVYAGDRPGVGASAGTATLLADIVLAVPCASVDGRVMSLAASSDVQCVGSGTAAWARIVTASGQVVIDHDVGATAGQIQVSPAQLYAGGNVRLLASTIQY